MSEKNRKRVNVHNAGSPGGSVSGQVQAVIFCKFRGKMITVGDERKFFLKKMAFEGPSRMSWVCAHTEIEESVSGRARGWAPKSTSGKWQVIWFC